MAYQSEEDEPGGAKVPPNTKKDMKTLNYVVSSIAVAFGLAVTTDAQQAPQRAAANHFEMNRPSTSAVSTTTGAPVERYVAGGKAAAHLRDLRKPATASSGVDVVHGPRPITASKDPDLERKWRENAQKFQVAPVK